MTEAKLDPVPLRTQLRNHFDHVQEEATRLGIRVGKVALITMTGGILAAYIMGGNLEAVAGKIKMILSGGATAGITGYSLKTLRINEEKDQAEAAKKALEETVTNTKTPREPLEAVVEPEKVEVIEGEKAHPAIERVKPFVGTILMGMGTSLLALYLLNGADAGAITAGNIKIFSATTALAAIAGQDYAQIVSEQGEEAVSLPEELLSVGKLQKRRIEQLYLDLPEGGKAAFKLLLGALPIFDLPEADAHDHNVNVNVVVNNGEIDGDGDDEVVVDEEADLPKTVSEQGGLVAEGSAGVTLEIVEGT